MKKKRVIITLKEQSTNQTGKLISFLNKKGVKNIKPLSTFGLIIGELPNDKTQKDIEAHVDVEAVSEDKEVHML